MILLAFNHGLRASEVIGLTGANVRDGFLDVQRLKGSLRTVQPLLAHENILLDERRALSELADKSNKNQRLFPITRQRFWQIVREHGKRAGIASHKLFPHALKHSTAMQMIDGAGIENTRQYLGHRRISSTGAYLRKTDEQASAAAAHALGARPNV